jgi:hypothetical protein
MEFIDVNVMVDAHACALTRESIGNPSSDFCIENQSLKADGKTPHTRAAIRKDHSKMDKINTLLLLI